MVQRKKIRNGKEAKKGVDEKKEGGWKRRK